MQIRSGLLAPIALGIFSTWNVLQEPREFYIPGLISLMTSIGIFFGYLSAWIDYSREIFYYEDKHSEVIGWDLSRGYDFTVVLRTRINPYYEFVSNEENRNEE